MTNNYQSVLCTDLSPPTPPKYFKVLQNRFDSFRCVVNLMVDDKTELAKRGFYYNENAKCFECAYCGTIISKFNNSSMKYHTFSTCVKSLQLLRENETLRKISFKSFKSARNNNKIDIDRLARNGFYFFGKRHEIMCSDCGLVLVKLHKNDHINAIHSVYSSSICRFVEQRVQKIVSEQRELAQKNVDPVSNTSVYLVTPSAPPENVVHDNNLTKLYPDLNFDISEMLASSSLSCEKNKSAETDSGNAAIFDDKDKIKHVVKNDSKVNNQRDDAECGVDNVTEDDKMCTICFENVRQICFSPCGHVSVCEICAKRCQKCCICRKTIRDKIKIFL
ncbi:iap2 [Hemileuca sp. nucleopolyhedrovirus]|uniref:Iap2 n=1 Tax=Hemileuca sp. nucleopolyhedrovirus TaxID=1367203 RepID=S5MQC9_9ABAC|nr:iap2 [Hemileuca sp. nucleopolyhedrovirus]AGR56814.1 iap2 [Hemileuca sp. nucleopolyhedrovirus]